MEERATVSNSPEKTEILIRHLNPPQRDAVTTLNGPLLILAGAGSGKTRVLTHRMANAIATGSAAPDELLAVTFTNKAAREMEHRIFGLLSNLGFSVREPLWVSTFHSFCLRVLKQHITLLDYKPHFVIYDDSDQLSLIKKVATALNINEKIFPAKAFRGRINNAKMLALSPEQVEKGSALFMDSKSIEVYKRYEEEMKRANALDFGDLLFKTYELFRMYPAVLEGYQQKFKYILVDEYQDTNHIQYLLIHELAKGHRNLCVVGDEDQSIYSWRGADISNILDFEKDFPEAKVIKLEENYRSSASIVAAATSVIKNNTERKDKTLFTSNPDGDPIQIREERNEYDEARFVVRNILRMIEEGDGSYSDYAIFYRTNAQSRVLEEQLRSNSIPYKIVGGVRFYDRMEVKDILAYLKLSLNPQDDIAFKRAVNTPARGIGKTTIEKLEDFASQKKVSMFHAVESACEERLFNSGVTNKLRNFKLLLEDFQKQVHEHKLLDFYGIVIDRTEYVVKLKAEESIESEARIQNLEELGNAMAQFQKERVNVGLQEFLEEMSLVSDADQIPDEQQATVTLMTLHVSKGLEYPYVFVVGWEENLFPSNRGEDADQDSEIEEERRLAYVGMTRARQKLFLTYARTRKVWGQDQFNAPSRFLKEIPEKLVQFSTSMAQPSFVTRQTRLENMKARTDDEYQEFPDYDEESTGDFQKGQRVRHPTFGPGSIFQVEGSGDQQKVSVMFADQTIKKFVAKYARLERN